MNPSYGAASATVAPPSETIDALLNSIFERASGLLKISAVVTDALTGAIQAQSGTGAPDKSSVSVYSRLLDIRRVLFTTEDNLQRAASALGI